MKQLAFKTTPWKHRFSHGGELRKLRAGRKARPLSSKDPIHLVLKANRETIRGGFRSYKRYFLIQKLVRVYSKRFFIKIEQISIQGDHVHLLIRISRRSLSHSFLRVLSGQIAQQLQAQGLTTCAVVQKKDTSLNRNAGLKEEKAVTDTLNLARKTKLTDTLNSKSRDPMTDTPKVRSPMRLWKYRPFTRVVKGFLAYRIMRDYISLNEAEAFGIVAYSKTRLRELSQKQLSELRLTSS